MDTGLHAGTIDSRWRFFAAIILYTGLIVDWTLRVTQSAIEAFTSGYVTLCAPFGESLAMIQSVQLDLLNGGTLFKEGEHNGFTYVLLCCTELPRTVSSNREWQPQSE